jgi:hypothetical protein
VPLVLRLRLSSSDMTRSGFSSSKVYPKANRASIRSHVCELRWCFGCTPRLMFACSLVCLPGLVPPSVKARSWSLSSLHCNRRACALVCARGSSHGLRVSVLCAACDDTARRETIGWWRLKEECHAPPCHVVSIPHTSTMHTPCVLPVRLHSLAELSRRTCPAYSAHHTRHRAARDGCRSIGWSGVCWRNGMCALAW